MTAEPDIQSGSRKRDEALSKNGQWRSFPKVPCLLQYVSNGNYYGRIRVNGKLIRVSLKTSVWSTARLQLAARYSSSCRCNVCSIFAKLTAKRLLARVTDSLRFQSAACAKSSNRFCAVPGRHSLWTWRNFSHFRFPAPARSVGVGNCTIKAQAAGRVRILKRLQCRVVILAQRGAQLIDQQGALLDQRHFIAAQQTPVPESAGLPLSEPAKLARPSARHRPAPKRRVDRL